MGEAAAFNARACGRSCASHCAYATPARKRSLLNRRLRKVEAIARLHRAHRIKRFHNGEPQRSNAAEGDIRMTSRVAPRTIEANQPGVLAEALNAVLADTFALYLKTKNFHWHAS